MKDQIKLSKLITNDYLIFAGVLTGVLLLAICIYGLIATVNENITIAYVFGGIAIASIVFSCARFFVLVNRVKKSVEVQGVVTSIYFYRSRGRVSLSYTFEGTLIQSGSSVVRNAKSRMIKPKQTLNLIINPDKPKQAMIIDLFK